MIQGQIDFSLLQSNSRPNFSTDSEINEPGLMLRQQGEHNQVVSSSDGFLLIAGTPRIRDARLALQVKQEGWAVLLPRLLAKPTEVLAHLAGRFSLLWLDPRLQQLGFASDRFNTFGYCYRVEGSRVSFASRADTVPTQLEIDPQSIFDYLYFHAIPAPRTIFRGINRLPPGSLLQASPAGVEVTPWWAAHFDEPETGDLKQLGESFRGIVQEAVAREASRPGSTGAFLSGGTDSSTVVGMLAKCSDTPVQAYSIGFEAAGYDEMEYARITARHYGVQHHEYYVTPEDLLTGIPAVAHYYDQPFGNSSAVPSYYCAKLAQSHGITRLLAGDGGDELFGGNTRYAKQQVFTHYQNVPEPLRKILLEPLLRQHWLHVLPFARKAASYIEQANTPLPDRTEQYNLLHRLGMAEVFEPGFMNQVDTGAPMALQRSVWNAIDAGTLINRQLGFDWRFTLADTDLPKVIGTTGLAGIEVAFPLLDDALVDFSANLPPQFKLKGQQLRWFFKEALRDFLPPQILTKPKHGFGLPFGPWMLKHDGLRKQATETLASLGKRGIVRPEFLHSLLQDRLAEHPGYYGEMVWICQMLEYWLQKNAPTFSVR